MQYNHLKAVKSKFDAAEKVELQELCTLAARHVPVSNPWTEHSQPWGCILDGLIDYCDLCPAQTFCPHPHKNFSK